MTTSNYEVFKPEHGVADQGLDARRARRGRGEAAAAEHRVAAVHLPLDRGHARRPPRHGRDGRQRDPDDAGDHPGGGRRRHRLRHDGGADVAQRERPAGQPRAAAQRHRAGRPARPHRQRRTRTTAARGAIRPRANAEAWARARAEYAAIVAKHPKLGRGNDFNHLGTLGTGNHFIEVCLDEADDVWIMLHCGSRGVGNRIGSSSSSWRRRTCSKFMINLPDQDLAYLPEGTEHFDDYVEAVDWAQDYAMKNRELMMAAIVDAVRASELLPPFEANAEAVNCHHNYVAASSTTASACSSRARARCARARRPRHHPGQHGRAVVHRARQGQPGELRELQPRRRTGDVAHRGQAPLHGRGPRRARPRASSAARTRT